MTPDKQISSPIISPSDESAINTWFEHIIDDIRADHLMYTSGAVTKEKKEFYDGLILGKNEALFTDIRQSSSKYFISSIVKDYLQELKNHNSSPLHLAMALSDSKILVWAVIRDNDELTEDALLISEAKVNGKYYEKGFYLNSTIVEESDKLSTPPHYQNII